ncbi:hypothetical protein AHF37_12015 [Paragonimus kellicotti]|nr:hypothetical protein AHF37_12015 [Paragonimus kellicotti]
MKLTFKIVGSCQLVLTWKSFRVASSCSGIADLCKNQGFSYLR